MRGERTHLELRGHVAVARGDAEDEGIELREVGGLDDGVGGLRRRVQLLEDVLRVRATDLFRELRLALEPDRGVCQDHGVRCNV